MQSIDAEIANRHTGHLCFPDRKFSKDEAADRDSTDCYRSQTRGREGARYFSEGELGQDTAWLSTLKPPH